MYSEQSNENSIGYSDSLEGIYDWFEPGIDTGDAEPNVGIVWVDEDDHEMGYALVMPNTLDGYLVVAVHDEAFAESDLTGVTFPEGIVRIGDGAFGYCYYLESISIPNGATSIGDNAFGLCYALTDAYIPASVTNIGENAFEACDDIVLHVQEGTYAEQYAKDNGIAYIIAE
jgi:hypothetical protein